MNKEGMKKEVREDVMAAMWSASSMKHIGPADGDLILALARDSMMGACSKERRNIQYLFAIGEEVVTDMGDKGIVTSMRTERLGNKYYVRTGRMETWYDVTEIKKTPENEVREDAEKKAVLRKRHIESLADSRMRDIIDPNLEAGMVELMKKVSAYREELEAMDSLDLEIMFLEQSICGYHSQYLDRLRKERDERDAKVDSIENKLAMPEADNDEG